MKVPIGRPIANTKAYVLDRNQRPVPIGVTGEIHIAGPGLAQGYLNRPELTEERFVANPFSPGTRLYRTGDLGRWRSDGNLEFLGRSDRQIKLRGFRIELEEIESVLCAHPAVRDAVVVAQSATRGEKQLVAYVVPRNDKTPGHSELSGYLKKRLPAYMIPAACVPLQRLPITAVGKIDHRALPAAPSAGRDRQQDWIAPRTPGEEMLARIWAGVLGVDRVGIDDNFFDLGGHSLLAVKLCARVEKVFGVRLPLTILFEAATIRHLAPLVQSHGHVHQWSSLVPIRAAGSRPPFYCIHGGDGHILKFRPLAELLGPEQPVFGLQSRAIEGREFPLRSVEQIAASYLHDIRVFQPEGPYYLGGYSLGGLIAFEMARQMRMENQQVPLLAFFDTLYPQSESDTATILGGTLQKWSRRIRREAAERIYSNCLRLGRPAPRLVRDFCIRDTHRRAAVAFQPKTYPGQITYFAAEDVNAEIRIQQWREHAAEGVEVRRIRGLHSDLFTSDGTGDLIRELRTCLDCAQSDRVFTNTDICPSPSTANARADGPVESSEFRTSERKAA
jgi:aspartate racemase